MSRVLVLGGSGFMGSAVVAHAQSLGIDCRSHKSIRVRPSPERDVATIAATWYRTNRPAFEDLCAAMSSCDVVINAAGMAAPGSSEHQLLLAANAAQPSVVARAAQAAGVGRFVHISTAAVQARLDPLDESPRWFPTSPYAKAKAEAERVLLSGTNTDRPADIVLYRPASVYGPGRPVTRSMLRLVTASPCVPAIDGGARPVPVALVDNVAAGVVFAATVSSIGPIVLQPWEGLTTRSLLELFGARRVVRLPTAAVDGAFDLLARPFSRSPGWGARFRRVELALRGQGLCAKELDAAGFERPVGWDGWEKLVADERSRRAPA